MDVFKCPGCGRSWDKERLKLKGNLAKENALARVAKYNLTPKEKETVEMMIDGLSYRQIADEMKTTEQSVKNRMTRVFEKVGCQSRSEMLSMLAFGEAE